MMKVPENFTFIRKDVKHARIQVNENGDVRVIIPNSFTQEDLEALLEKKKKWIEKNKKFFNNKSKIELQRNQLLLFGNRYSYFYDATYKRKFLLDHDHKTIRAQRDLLDISIQEKWYKSVAKKYLRKRAEELAERLNFKYNQIYIRSQHKKFGNCSEDKNISFNWRVIKAPEFVIDYIIIHELVHTRIMNHSTKFWLMVKSLYPDYKDAINWLEKYGNSL